VVSRFHSFLRTQIIEQGILIMTSLSGVVTYSFLAVAVFSGVSRAQSITITPTMPSVGAGGTVQFSAQLRNLPNATVGWSAGGKVGGGATAGTISPTGLYTAPAKLPGQNPVQITASVTNSKVSATTYVSILSNGPTITAVSPNPLPTGTYAVTITGSGFLYGATVMNSGIQLSTTSVTSTTVKATGYQAPAASATFSVKNPGSLYSNPIVVPVKGSSPAAYTLKVVNGSGGGSYAAGTSVTITANAPPRGEAFLDWTGATVANADASTTTLKMPAANTTVTANCETTVIKYRLSVVNGSGGGAYAAGTSVTITANAPPPGEVFLDWSGATVTNASAPSTTLAMPAGNASVTANYSTQPPGPVSCHNMSTGVDASLNGFVPFPPTNAWNTDISSAPLDPNNGAITSAAGFAGLHLHHDFSSVAGGNYGIPYVVVDSSSTPLVPINVIDYASESDVAWAPYPLTAPIEGAPADCYGWPDTYVGDSHVLVLDRNACMLYETFNTHRCNGAWNASSETIWDLKNYDQRPWGWTSADAAGLPIFPGLVRYDEVASGAINHAIRFTMQVTKNDANGGYFVEPASHAAGVYWGVSNVMGMRVRLKSSFDISGYSTTNQVILTAMKKYGMILADNGGYFYFQGVPDTRWNDADLVNLDSIQSSNFEVVQMTPVYPGYDAATAPTGQPPAINSFTASASTVAAGTPVTLTWNTSNDTYDFIDKLGGVSGGSATTNPAVTTTYTLNATNQYGRSTMQVTVKVK
jgi:hypothetical protein